MIVLHILAAIVFITGLWFLYLTKPATYPDDETTTPALVITPIAGAWTYTHLIVEWDLRLFLASCVYLIVMALLGVVVRSTYLNKKRG